MYSLIIYFSTLNHEKSMTFNFHETIIQIKAKVPRKINKLLQQKKIQARLNRFPPFRNELNLVKLGILERWWRLMMGDCTFNSYNFHLPYKKHTIIFYFIVLTFFLLSRIRFFLGLTQYRASGKSRYHHYHHHKQQKEIERIISMCIRRTIDE